MKIQGGTMVALLGAIMLGVAAVGYLFWRHAGALECNDNVLTEYPASDGKLVAVRWERDCNGAIATHVSLRPRDDAQFDADEDQIFAAAGRPELSLIWKGPRRLQLKCATDSALGERTRWRDVEIARVR